MPKIVITAVYAFEPDMVKFGQKRCQTIEDVQQYLQHENNAEDHLFDTLLFQGGGNGILDCKVEIDRSDEG